MQLRWGEAGAGLVVEMIQTSWMCESVKVWKSEHVKGLIVEKIHTPWMCEKVKEWQSESMKEWLFERIDSGEDSDTLENYYEEVNKDQ